MAGTASAGAGEQDPRTEEAQRAGVRPSTTADLGETHYSLAGSFQDFISFLFFLKLPNSMPCSRFF